MILPINIKNKSNILIAGIGGGYDFLCGLPIALNLQKQGHTIYFANYSFTNLKHVSKEHISNTLVKVSHESTIDNETYFPELYLAQWFKKYKKLDIPIFCFDRTGVIPLTQSYNYIQKMYNIDAVITIDGGVDGIFRGDEYGLGTPSMDSISMVSAHLSTIKNSYYVFTGFGSEGANHEVAHADVLKRIADLTKNNGYYGVTSLIAQETITKEFVDACRYIFNNMPKHQWSNIVCSILKSLEGFFAYTSVNEKTVLSPLWISAFTSMYWFFDLKKVVTMKLFYNDIKTTHTVEEVHNAIELYRKNCSKTFDNIPI